MEQPHKNIRTKLFRLSLSSFPSCTEISRSARGEGEHRRVLHPPCGCTHGAPEARSFPLLFFVVFLILHLLYHPSLVLRHRVPRCAPRPLATAVAAIQPRLALSPFRPSGAHREESGNHFIRILLRWSAERRLYACCRGARGAPGSGTRRWVRRVGDWHWCWGVGVLPLLEPRFINHK